MRAEQAALTADALRKDARVADGSEWQGKRLGARASGATAGA